MAESKTVKKSTKQEYKPGKVKNRCDFKSWDEYNKYLATLKK